MQKVCNKNGVGWLADGGDAFTMLRVLEVMPKRGNGVKYLLDEWLIASNLHFEIGVRLKKQVAGRLGFLRAGGGLDCWRKNRLDRVAERGEIELFARAHVAMLYCRCCRPGYWVTVDSKPYLRWDRVRR